MIKIAGWQKMSLIDYPGKVACVIFLAGCNMRCHYCHNAHLFDPEKNQIDFAMVLNYLRANRTMLDAVVLSGGEPTLDNHLLAILRALRKLGLLIKLDTNGTRPDVVRKVVTENLVDYVALDIKATAGKYPAITGMSIEPVQATLEFLRTQKQVPVMLRTTVSPQLTTEDLIEMGEQLINGAAVWQIQQCRTDGAYPPEKIRKMAGFLQKYAQHIVLKGL